MDELESALAPSEELRNPPPTGPKAPSGPRGLRTSCDLCKKMKVKCQKKEDGRCTRCITRNLVCTTTPVKKSRPRITSKREAYLHQMEARIKSMETAIIDSGIHGSVDLGIKDDEESIEKIRNQAMLSNQMSTLVIDSTGSPNFIGSASGFALFSPQGFRWISNKVGDKNELSQLFRILSQQDHGIWGSAGADLWYPRPRSEHMPLPSKDTALRYLNSFFRTFNNVFPVINQKVFDYYFDQQYSANPPESIAWYALFNTVLSLGCIRTESNQKEAQKWSYLVDYTSNTSEIGAGYFRNAASCFHDLYFHGANLMAMQAITLMLLITTSSPNPQPAYVLTAAAGNMANTLGLHRNFDGFTSVQEETEQRRNVFWMFYLLEKAVSHNLGRPSVINDDDIAVDLPPKRWGLISFPSGEEIYDIFQDQVKLAIIISRIYTELYSASSQTKPDAQRMRVLNKLDEHLQHWRDSIPSDIRPENPIRCSAQQYISVALMHLTYLNALILLHRLPSNQEPYTNIEATELSSHDQTYQMDLDTNTSQLLCLAAARRSIHILNTFNDNNNLQEITWMALYYPLSAGLVIFTHILSNPRDQQATSDLRLMGLIDAFITNSVQQGSSFADTPTVIVFKELYHIATRFVERMARDLNQMLAPGDGTAQPDLPISQPLHDLQITDPESNPFATGFDPIYSGEEIIFEQARDDSPLQFAPFIPPELGQFAHLTPAYNPLSSNTGYQWGMANVWMPDFGPDAWDSAGVGRYGG